MNFSSFEIVSFVKRVSTFLFLYFDTIFHNYKKCSGHTSPTTAAVSVVLAVLATQRSQLLEKATATARQLNLVTAQPDTISWPGQRPNESSSSLGRSY